MRSTPSAGIWDWLLLGVVAVCIGMAGAGCAGKPKSLPLQMPPAAIRLTHFTGSAISGPLAPAAPFGNADEALAVTFSVIALDGAPSGTLTPLGPSARLIHASADGHAVRPSTRLMLGMRLEVQAEGSLIEALRPGDANHAVMMAENRGALPTGVTAALSIADAGAADRRERFVEVAISRRLSTEPTTLPATPAIELAVVLQDWIASPEDHDSLADVPKTAPSRRDGRAVDEGDGAAASPPLPMILQREIAVLDPIAIDAPRTIALVIPFAFSDQPAQSLAVLIDVSLPQSGDEALAQLVAQCADDLARSAEAVRQSQTVDAQAGAWPGFQAAFDAMRQPATRRAALVFLAGRTGATICEDAAMVCDELSLDQLNHTIIERADAQPRQSRTGDELGWVLDYSALEFMAAMATSNRLGDELRAVLLRQTGEIGREASSVQQVLRDSSSRADFDRRLMAENLLYLEDSSPAARVRAFEWLVDRQAAPAHYDPLSDNKQRRAALDAAIQTMQSPAKGDAP